MHFELWQSDQDQQWYWHLRAANGEIIAPSQGYTHRADAEHCINLVRSCANAPVEVLA